MTTDLVDWLAVEYGDAERHEDGGARHVDHGLVEEQSLRPPVAGKQRPALNDGGLSHSDITTETDQSITSCDKHKRQSLLFSKITYGALNEQKHSSFQRFSHFLAI